MDWFLGKPLILGQCKGVRAATKLGLNVSGIMSPEMIDSANYRVEPNKLRLLAVN